MIEISVQNWAFTLFNLLISFIGIPGNSLIIRVYSARKTKSSTDVLIRSLAISDLIFCSLQLSILYRLTAKCPQMTRWSCIGESYFRSLSLLNSLLITGFIAVDRYFAVCKPLTRKISPRRARKISIACFICSWPTATFVCSASEVFEFNIDSFDNSTIAICTTCTFIQDVRVHQATAVIFGFVIISLFLTMGILYSLVYRAIRKQAQVRVAMGVVVISNYHERSAVSDQIHDQQGKTVAFGQTKDSLPQSSGQCQASMSGSTKHELRTEITKDHEDLNALPPVLEKTKESDNIWSTQIKPDRSNIIPPREVKSKTASAIAYAGKSIKTSYQRKNTRMLVTITALTFITWLPSMVVETVIFFDPDVLEELTYNHIVFVGLMQSLYSINYASNFIIYFTINLRFREECLTVLRRTAERFRILRVPNG